MSSSESAPATGSPVRSRILRRLVAGHPGAVIALAFLSLLVVAAAGADVLARFQPLDQDLASALDGPGTGHWLGTDTLGRDILSRLMFGARPMLVGVAEALLTALVLSVPAGLAAGYFGRWIDAWISRIFDVMSAVPAIILLLVVLSVFSANQTAAMVALGILVSPGLMRVVRGQTLAVRHELFIDAARVAGLSDAAIVRRHVLPRVIGPLITQATLVTAGAVLMVAGLGFLGLGPPPPNPSWGQMVAEAATQFQNQLWLVVPAGGVVTLTSLSLGVIGEALRDTTTATWSRPRPARATGTGRSVGVDALSHGGGPAAPDALLRVRGVSVVLAGADGDASLLDDVSFDVRPGETVGIVGESGCGKTLTSLAIMGMLPPGARVVAGSCVFAGEELTRATGRRWREIRGGRIAMISQSPMTALDPVFTVRNQVAEAVRTHQRCSRRKAYERVNELLAMVGLPDPEAVGRRYPHELSGGMAQRVCIAIALAGKPALLVADEPTTALDVTAQAAILDLLRTLQREQGLAVLLVTHDWGVVADLCQRAVVMYAGQVVENGDVRSVVRQPQHPYSEALLRSNPAHAKPRTVLPVISGAVPAPGEWMTGCRFAPRCGYTGSACVGAAIPLTQRHDGHRSRCIRVAAEASAGRNP